MKEIKLTLGKVALVDDEDYEYLSQWKWYAHKQTRSGFRAVRINKATRKIVIMARVIMGIGDGPLIVDHIDRDGLNNQRNNLRVCTKHQNNFNKSVARNSTSKYLGVSLDQWGKWRATITLNYKQYSLGRYENEIDAAKAYNEKAKELFGEFANLNEV